MKRSILILLFFLMTFQWVSGETIFPQKVVPDIWLKNWMLCGPVPVQNHSDPGMSGTHYPGFDTDYLAKLGGETGLKIKEGDAVKLKKGAIKWKYCASPDSVIDLVANISKISPALAYAYTEVESDQEGIWLIGLGTNDGARLWINGIRVWDYQPERGLKIDADQIPVFLKKGKNTILLKVEQRGNRWGFCMRFHPFSASAALKRGTFFSVTSGEDGSSKLASKFIPDVLSDLLQSVQVEVKDFQEKVVLSEERKNAFTGLLNLPSKDYKPYTAFLTLQMKSGETLPYSIGFTSGKRIEYVLFSNGRSDYRIAVSPDASESEKWAAGELHHWIQEMSGVKLPVSDFDNSYAGPQIVLGYNEQVRKITGLTEPFVLDESYRYFNSGANIYIFGGKQRGTQYGVLSFLENEMGCRWYTPAVTVVPKRAELKFTWFDHAEKPGIRVRNDFYFEAFDPVWAARNKMNGTLSFSDKPGGQPGGVEGYWSVHTFFPLMPPNEFFGKHPEYYSLIDGVRTHERAQLCLSNPEVLRIIAGRIKDRMRQSPEYLIYDVSQNDWENPCQCNKCQGIAKKYGGESGIMIWFVNQVAEAVEADFPDKFIGTLAYQYTRHAPQNISPRKNVVVRLCSIECCVAHDFESCSENSSFLNDLQNWAAIAPHMYIWDYVVNFNHYIMPFPNFKAIQPKIRTFQKNKAIGIMEQAAYQSRGGEFAELRAYLIAKLLWNPDGNADDIINDFMYGYYGRAGKFVRQYFDLLQNRVTPETHFPYGVTPSDQIYSDDFISQSAAIFAEAEKVADNDELLHRIEMASLPVLYLKCKRMPLVARMDGSYDKFCRVVESEGIKYYAERGESHRKAFHLEVGNAKE